MIPGLALPLLASGGGVIPGAVNWANISATIAGTNAAKQVSDLGQPVLFRMSVSGVSTLGSGQAIIGVIVNGVFAGNVSAVNGDTLDFSVSPESSIYFTAYGGSSQPVWGVNCTITIKYRSTGAGSFDTTLDTFTVGLNS